MKHKELVQSLALRLNRAEKDVDAMMLAAVDALKSQLAEGNRVNFQGFGAFEQKRKEERLSVHPVTKKRTLIPPKLVVSFKQSNTLKVKLKDIPHHE